MTSSSLRPRTTPTRTRSSRRFPAVCPRSTSRAAAAAKQSRTRASPSASVRRSLRCSTGSSPSTSSDRPRSLCRRSRRSRTATSTFSAWTPSGAATEGMASAARAARAAARGTIGLVTRSWPRHSRLFLVGEGSGWVIDHELAALSSTASALGYRVADPRLLRASRDQCAFYGSQFTLLVGPWSPPPHRLGAAYFHGLPGTPGMPEFDECYRTLCEHHRELARVQVSHGEIEELVLSSGIDPAKVFRIPIGIEGSYFHPPEPRRRDELRAELGFPPPAFVVGCFQKDGVGWGDGRQPKEIKGPDVLLQALELLRERVPEL